MGAVLGWGVLGEPLGAGSVLGGVLIAAGMILAARETERERDGHVR